MMNSVREQNAAQEQRENEDFEKMLKDIEREEEWARQARAYTGDLVTHGPPPYYTPTIHPASPASSRSLNPAAALTHR